MRGIWIMTLRMIMIGGYSEEGRKGGRLERGR